MKINSLILFLFAVSFLIFSCKSKVANIDGDDATILVQMFDDISILILEENYKIYNLQYKKVVSKPMNIHLFKFNPEKITDVELIKLLKQSHVVKEAQLNRNVQPRN